MSDRFASKADRRSRLATAAGALTLLLLIATPTAHAAPAFDAGSASAGPATIEDRPVSFSVADTNTSDAACPSDGAAYTVHGHLVGPAAVLRQPRADTPVTVYVYGYDGGEWNWHLPLAGYDHAAEMANLGQVSVTIDLVGYGATGGPANGNLACVGSFADVTHQVITELRAATYTTSSTPPTAFDKVLLAGHDVGGLVAEIEAASYADVDGLIVTTWADQGQTPFIIERAIEAANEWCTTNTNGYAHFATEDDWRSWIFYDADPNVIDTTDTRRNANPCGLIRSAPLVVARNQASRELSRITVPVLIVFGDKDTMIWTRDGQQAQQTNFTGSSDVTTTFIPYAGHFPMFERSAPRYRSVLARWIMTRFPDADR